MYVPVHSCTINISLHQIQVRYQELKQVPIHQASFDHGSKGPSARCWGWGKGRLGTGLLFSQKIAQVLVRWSLRAHSCNKWSCKLYLEGKVQRDHFLRTKHCAYLSPNGVPFVPDLKPVCKKPGNFSRLSSVGLKMADGKEEKKFPLPSHPRLKCT